jgi:hypothetical protein
MRHVVNGFAALVIYLDRQIAIRIRIEPGWRAPLWRTSSTSRARERRASPSRPRHEASRSRAVAAGSGELAGGKLGRARRGEAMALKRPEAAADAEMKVK